MNFILGSSSPRRLELLGSIGINPDKVVSPDIDEKINKNESPLEYSKRISFEKINSLKIGFAASFSAKLADTFGSEIGKRFGGKTYLITSLKKVERGTEGGISLEGTLASFLGAIFMAFVMLSLSIISNEYQFIIMTKTI